MSGFHPLQTLAAYANALQMSLWRGWTNRIKREVATESPTGWLIGGGYAVRQLKGMTLLLPVLAAGFLLRDGLLQDVIIWGFIVAWALYAAVTWATGTFFISKWIDRYFDRKVCPNLSKEYRKR